MKLMTKIEQIIVNPDFSEIKIPAGTEGEVIDIIIENGEARFLLDFAELGTYEWYDTSELEDKF